MNVPPGIIAVLPAALFGTAGAMKVTLAGRPRADRGESGRGVIENWVYTNDSGA